MLKSLRRTPKESRMKKIKRRSQNLILRKRKTRMKRKKANPMHHPRPLKRN
jgi:hypothetical protein